MGISRDEEMGHRWDLRGAGWVVETQGKWTGDGFTRVMRLEDKMTGVFLLRVRAKSLKWLQVWGNGVILYNVSLRVLVA